MGSSMSRSIRTWKGRKLRRVLLVGLDNSGKTTLLNKFMQKKDISTVPTRESEYIQTNYKRYQLLITDVGGQETLRPYWRHHFTGSQGVVYVIDSSDKDRIETAMNELHVLLVDDQLKDVPVILFANKQDSPGAIRKDYLKPLLPKTSNHVIDIVEGSAINEQGIYELLDLLTHKMKSI